MRPIKILHIITRIDRWGSAQEALLTVRELSRIPDVRRQKSEYQKIRESEYQRKYEVTLVTGSVRDIDPALMHKCGVNVVIIPELMREINPVTDIICLFKLYRFIKKGRFNIVHTHSSKAGFLGRVAAKMAGCSIIVHIPHGHIFYGYFNPQITKLFILLEKIAAKFTDKIISLTDSETYDYLKFKVAPQEKFLTIHDGIEIERFVNPRVNKTQAKACGYKELGIQGSPVVISVARLVPIKGHKYLIDAASKVVESFPDTKFLLVGDGPLRIELEQKAKSLGLAKNVFFLGDRDDIPELLAISDVFALASLNEGMGIAIVEAMASGLPVVATNVGGIPDIVKNGVTGLLVPPKDSEILSIALLKLLKERKLAECMGKEGKKRASLYSVEKMVEKIDELYDKLKNQK